MPTGLWASADIFAPTNPFAPAGLVLYPHTDLPVVQDMTKLFFIRKLVTAVNNTTIQMYIKVII